MNSSKSGLQSCEIHGTKSLNSPLILCLLILLQVFTPSTKLLSIREPLRMAHQHSFKGNYNQSQNPKVPFPCTEPGAQLHFISVGKLPPILPPCSIWAQCWDWQCTERAAGWETAYGQQLYTLVIFSMSSGLTTMSFQEKVSFIEIERFLPLRSFQDAILKYKMFMWASQGALQGVELSQSLAGRTKSPLPMSANMCDTCVFMRLYRNYYLGVVYSLGNHLYHH